MSFDASVVSSADLDISEQKRDQFQQDQKQTKAAAEGHFRRFLRSFRNPVDNTFKYRDVLKANYDQQEFYFVVDVRDVAAFSQELFEALLRKPAEHLPLLESAALQVIATLTAPRPKVEDMTPMQAQLRNLQRISDIRKLAASDVSQLVCLRGMIINAGKPRIKATTLAVACRNCRQVKKLACGPGFGSLRLPRTCESGEGAEGKAKCPLDPFQILPDTTRYVDQQKLKVQETPESVPTGEMPRSVNISAERYLVGRVKPGSRCTIIGIFSTFTAKTAGGKSIQNAREVGLRMTYLRAVGIEVDNEAENLITGQFEKHEEEEMLKISRSPNLYESISKSIAPAIWGSEDIKKALAAQLFGGCRKYLPDGMRLRGDINILLLGDPSVAKSQFLKFIHQVAPIGVYTSGKGSSAAGLTASVIRDPSSGEFHLEGGALVLADGGLVCIDEFDKMREQDRVAIHEAMEQQTISIAKAGITTILNSRTSVLAAANPIFGRYDDMKTPTENIDFQSTILSRFDLIFIIKDIHDPTRDKALVKYIINIHKNREQAIKEQKDAGDVMDVERLRKYVAYSRQNAFPRLSAEAALKLSNHYVALRAEYKKHKEEHDSQTAIPITVRQLEAIVRISEALARMSLSPEANSDHVDEAIRLFRVSTFQAATTGVGDFINTPAFMERVQKMERLLRRRIPIGSKVQRNNIVRELAGENDQDQNAANRALEIMVQRNEFKALAQGRMVERLR